MREILVNLGLKCYHSRRGIAVVLHKNRDQILRVLSGHFKDHHLLDDGQWDVAVSLVEHIRRLLSRVRVQAEEFNVRKRDVTVSLIAEPLPSFDERADSTDRRDAAEKVGRQTGVLDD